MPQNPSSSPSFSPSLFHAHSQEHEEDEMMCNRETRFLFGAFSCDSVLNSNFNSKSRAKHHQRTEF
ncbi:hypothetical protein E2562_001752 [Oryza meyeriana var. granulata]|uniref:Uncharacterized protein n=1 Tax=Oryza meyeriana var. granulata TaxID=110450 RepID=A0A6G1CD62_9ORYZ|nr:hypothetical protein E2562_001752 [Oryza meyeriana var. granulata]